MDLGELLKRAQKNDKEAMNEVIKSFMPLIIKLAKSTYISGYVFDDLKQIGSISIIKSIRKINLDRGGNYTAYIVQAIKRNFYYEIRRKVKENHVLSLNKTNEEGMELGDLISSDLNIEADYEKKELLERLYKIIEKLDENEKEIIKYILAYNKGGLMMYSKNKNIKYTTCIKRRDKLLRKIKKELI